MPLLGLMLPWWGRWAAIALLLAAVAGFGALKMRQHDNIRYEALQREYADFKAKVAAEGAAAQQRAIAQAQIDKRRKEKADAEYAKTSGALAIALNSLRVAADSRSHGLPAAPASSNRHDLACFDRAIYQREDGEITKRLVDGARRLADEGTASTVGLDSTKKWAADVK